MKAKNIYIFIFMLLAGGYISAQIDRYELNATTNGTTISIRSGFECMLVDDGGDSNSYTAGKDYVVSIKGSCQNPHYLAIYFDSFNIAYTDTLYIYDGPSTSDSLIIKGNSRYHPLGQKYFYVSPTNSTNTLTIRLKTSQNSPLDEGFILRADCKKVCENIYPKIENTYYRTRNGQICDTSIMKMVYITDSLGDTVNTYRSVNLCQGEGAVLNAHFEWDPIYATGHFIPTDSTVNFLWNLGFDDSIRSVRRGYGMKQVISDAYEDVKCYNVLLELSDTLGCISNVQEHVNVQIAQNPIKTIFDLATICTGDTLITKLGYDGDYASITLAKIEFDQTKSKVNEVRTFIPDGPHCNVACYSAPVTFTEFPRGKRIISEEEICSVCINYEHTFMGDYRLSLVCPTRKKAVLKFASASHDPEFSGGLDESIYPDGSFGGSSLDAGIALRNYDGSNHCDSLINPYGVGWNYCFSRNKDYTLIDGQPASTITPGAHYLGSPNTVTTIVNVPPSPVHFVEPYPGGILTTTTQDSSNHAGKRDYYKPWSDFSELIGCPMNGTWEVEICDYWGADNGWVFNWSLDLCGISSIYDCDYQVGLDSLHWLPDTAGGKHCDYETGKYRGLEIFKIDSISSGMTTTDTAGTFPINITLFDEFGCVWDTSTSIKSVWKPQPELGDSVVICGDDYITLDAKDRYEERGNYSYLWDPYGQRTDTIHSAGAYGQEIYYVVEVYNTQNGVRCTGRDTTKVTIYKQPIPNFDIAQYPLEGCEPYTINIYNKSLDAIKYRWDFGDGTISTEENPKHSYRTGTYDFKLYVYSEDGCMDSLVYNQMITVYPSPDARFSWDPVYPSIREPIVYLENRTVPDDPSIDYFWEIQYDKDYPYSFHTLYAKDTSFTWDVSDGEDISGEYIVRLISRSSNVGPSGYPVYCSDTIQNTVLLLNDFIQFPNLITPNGDGVNDVFEIINLLEGQAYPTNSIDIYNKWGARVYHKDNISKYEDFWDPAVGNINAGTYFYQFTGRGYTGAVERKGSVEVMK